MTVDRIPEPDTPPNFCVCELTSRELMQHATKGRGVAQSCQPVPGDTVPPHKINANTGFVARARALRVREAVG